MDAHTIGKIVILFCILAFFLLAIVLPISRILRRAGFSGWLSLLYFVPIANLIMLWVFAYAPWPALGQKPS